MVTLDRVLNQQNKYIYSALAVIFNSEHTLNDGSKFNLKCQADSTAYVNSTLTKMPRFVSLV